MGAWQAGCLESLTRAGLKFDKVLGFSAGGLSGAAYTFGFQDELLDRWRNTSRQPLLKFKPTLQPFSLFSGEGVWGSVQNLTDDEAMKRAARCELTILTHRIADGATVYHRFCPKGVGGWDGPLAERLVAGCAIPWIFPPVTIQEGGAPAVHMDGGIPGKEWMNFDALKGCKDVVVLEMVRPDERGAKTYTPVAYYEQLGRETCLRQIESGIESTAKWEAPPRIFRLQPAQRLGFTMLDFKDWACAPAVDQGLKDGNAFLAAPSALRP